MAKILVHITVGPDNATKAALAFLVARTVASEGHALALFVAGDGVHLLTGETVQTLEGLGTGKLSEHIEALNGLDGIEAFYSGLSAKARGIAPEHVILRGAQAAMPTKLVQLTAECDKVLCY